VASVAASLNAQVLCQHKVETETRYDKGNGPPSPGSATPRLAKSILVDVDMASSARRSSPGSPNFALGEENPFAGP